MSKGFPQAIGAGLFAGVAIAVGFFATIVATAAVADDLFFTIRIGAFVFAFMGAAITGAVIGMAAGVRASGTGQGFAAGLMVGLVGQFIVLVGLFGGLGAAINIAEEGAEADEVSLAWADLPAAAMFCIPAALVASITGGAAGSRPSRKASRQPVYAPQTAYPAEPAPAFRPPQADVHLHHAPVETRTPMVRCPRCATSVAAPPGQQIVCPTCGFR